MLERIALMGAGSLGTILSAYIARQRQIDVIDVNKAHVDAMNEKGARVSGTVDMVVPVHALTPDQMEGEYDLFIYMAKQTFNDTALPQMLSHLKKDGIIVTCQNGLPEPEICKVWPKEQVFGAPVAWGASYVGPGESRLTSDPNHMEFTLGPVTGVETPVLAEIKEILEMMCPVTISMNLMGLRWCKLLTNATMSGLGTVCGGTFGSVFHDEIGIRALIAVGQETCAACAASGVTMEPFEGIDFPTLFDVHTEAQIKNFIIFWRTFFTPQKNLVPSMEMDLNAGRKCEVDAINGVVSQTGREYGVPTPVCDQVVDIIKKVQDGRMKMEMANFGLLKL